MASQSQWSVVLTGREGGVGERLKGEILMGEVWFS